MENSAIVLNCYNQGLAGGGGKGTPLVRCSLCNPEDLHSVPRAMWKSQVQWCMPVTAAPGAETGGVQQTTHGAELGSSQSRETLTHTQQGGKTEADARQYLSHNTCAQWWTQTQLLLTLYPKYAKETEVAKKPKPMNVKLDLGHMKGREKDL